MAVKVVSLLALLALNVPSGCTYDLTGIKVDGNRLVNHLNQTVVLRVSRMLWFDYYCAWVGNVSHVSLCFEFAAGS